MLVAIGGFYFLRSRSASTQQGTSVTMEIVTTSTITSTTTPTTTIDPNATHVPGTCLVLEERYCQLGKVEIVSDDGGTAANFKLPAGTPVFSPFTGTVAYFPAGSGNGFYVDLLESDLDQSTFRVIYTLDESKTIKTHIQKGEVLARVGVANFDAINQKFNIYNLALMYIKDGVLSAELVSNPLP